MCARVDCKELRNVHILNRHILFLLLHLSIVYDSGQYKRTNYHTHTGDVTVFKKIKTDDVKNILSGIRTARVRVHTNDDVAVTPRTGLPADDILHF